MDPRYRPFYQHVWAFCWPILWWNLMRLAAVQRKVKRNIWVTVTRTGQIRVRYIADAPVRRVLPEWSARWERPSLASDLPACLALMEAQGVPPRIATLLLPHWETGLLEAAARMRERNGAE